VVSALNWIALIATILGALAVAAFFIGPRE
jgi:nicotinamide riboside transporter PnuC